MLQMYGLVFGIMSLLSAIFLACDVLIITRVTTEAWAINISVVIQVVWLLVNAIIAFLYCRAERPVFPAGDLSTKAQKRGNQR